MRKSSAKTPSAALARHGVPLASLASLVEAIDGCRLCVDRPAGVPLPHPPRPIFRLSRTARLVIASQAPGARAHASGVPFDDASGQRLRQWIGLSREAFYDSSQVAIVPMGFCFPGYDSAGGDRPPRAECRLAWHDAIFAALPQVDLIVCIGVYASRYHLTRLGLAPDRPARMSDLMAQWRVLARNRAPRIIALPHPSWRNTAWLRRNPWFETEVLPELRAAVSEVLDDAGHSG